MDKGFDFVIVGAGSAGCVIAARLSEIPEVSVLLLEAGGADDDPRIQTPSKFGTLNNTKFDWGFRTAPQAELHNRQIAFPRGRVIGGTGSINYMIYLRGHPSDYDHWRQLGCTGWSWDDVLPYFRRSEGNQIHKGPLHGQDGPLIVDQSSEPSRLTGTFLQACQESGIPFNPDLNGPDIEGCGYFPATIYQNQRCSTASAYLRPALGRPNLTVIKGARITKLVLNGTNVIGVDYLVRGESHRALVTREVILSAGAIGSPHLLLISGIGPADLLRSADIDVVHDLQGVGENLQDHVHYRSRWEITEPLSLYGRSAKIIEANQHRYDTDKSGPLITNHFESGAFLSSSRDSVAPDMELLMIPYFISLDAPEFRAPDRHGFTISGYPTRPLSRGSVTIASNDPLDRPVINPNYLSEPEDMRLMVEIIKRTREIVTMPAFDSIRGTEISPGPAVKSDKDMIAAIRAISSTSFHPVGTCKMGIDDMAVVDPELKVRGLNGLRIADASIMPTMNTGHPLAPTIMIAEKAADMIRDKS